MGFDRKSGRGSRETVEKQKGGVIFDEEQGSL